MPKNLFYEIHLRKDDKAGIFDVHDEAVTHNFAEMCAIAKKIVDDGKADEAVVVEKRPVKRFTRYPEEG